MADLPLSVFIPSYNYGRFIGQAIESILSQSFADFELIIIDNASTDETVEVVRRYSDKRICFIVNDRNEGAHYSARRFYDLASGRYVRVLSADDVLIDGVLEEQVRALDRYESVALVTCDILETDANLQNPKLLRMYPGFASGETVIAQSLRTLDNLIGGPSNYMLRRVPFESLPIDPSYTYLSDLKLGIALLRRRHFINIGRPGYYYRRHGVSDTDRNCPPALQAEEWLRLNLENESLCHLNCWSLLRRPLGSEHKSYLRRWLAANLFNLESLRASYTARKRQSIHRHL